MRQKFKEIYKEFSDEYPGIYAIATEEFNKNGDVINKVTEHSFRLSSGTEYVSGYSVKKIIQTSDCGIWSPSLIKNKEGEWCIYSNGKFFPMTKDNLRTHDAAHLKMALDGVDPDVEKKLRSLPGMLAKIGAFATTTGGRGTFVVVGKRLINVGCDKGFYLMGDAGVIDRSGDFLNVKLTDKRLKTLGVSIHDRILEDLLELVSK
jgi:hypothetical protein